MSIFAELKRRNVFRVAVAYVAVAWLIVQVVDTLFPMYGLSDAAARTVVTILAVGFIPAVISAWAFELTPGGLVRDSDVDRTSPVVRRMGKRLDRLIIVVLTVALAYFVYDKFVATEPLVTEASIAVLAFDDLSPEGDQEYFADGIAEELLNLFARIPELRVAGRTSAFSFKGKDATIAEIADVLNVSYVLEGSVRMAGDQIRITAQLIEARSDSHIWSETYDRTMDDILAIQDDVAARVVDALRMKLLGQVPRVEEIDVEAYVLTMQARHLANQNEENLPKVEALLKQAWSLDPDSPRIGYEMRRLYMDLVGAGLLGQEEGRRLKDDVTARMIAADPNNSFTIAALAFDALIAGDLENAARLYERALDADPTNVDVTRWGRWLAFELGHLDIALELAEYTAKNDPLCGQCYYMLGGAYRDIGQWDKARSAFQRAVHLGHPSEFALVTTELLTGDPQAALEALEALPENEQTTATRAIALHDLRRQQEFDTLFNDLRESPSDDEHAQSLSVASVYAWIGDSDKAFEWLQRARALKPEPHNSPYLDPYFENIYDDPRWEQLMRDWGLQPKRQYDIEFEINLPK